MDFECHRDIYQASFEEDGEMNESDIENRGHFLKTIHFRAETDVVLQEHFNNSAKNATYTRKTIKTNRLGSSQIK